MSAHARPGTDPAMAMNIVGTVRSLLAELAASGPDTVAPATAAGQDGLTDDQWQAVVPLLPLGERGPYPEGLRDQFDGVMWRFRTGSSWRNMPARYGAWQTVHHRFQQWARAGTFESLVRASGTTVTRPQLLDPLRKAAEEERRLRTHSEASPPA
ncbi:transposase [Streptomyces sp. NPDC054770]